MTDQLPFHLEYGQGLKRLGLEARSSTNDYNRGLRQFKLYREMGMHIMAPKTTPSLHDTGRAVDINGRLTEKAKAQARAYAKASGAMYVVAASRRGPFDWASLVDMQEQLMRRMYDPQLDKYFTGGEYNGRFELLLPSTQSDLLRRA